MPPTYDRPPLSSIPVTYYPRYCFCLSRSFTTWARLTAYNIHNHLHRPASILLPPDIWHLVNHPIRAVRTVGTVVAVKIYETRTTITIDDYSGETLDLSAQHEKCDLQWVKVGKVLKARGTIIENRGGRQMVVNRAEVAKDEVEAWKELVEWQKETVLSGIWRLEEEVVEKMRRRWKREVRKKREAKEEPGKEKKRGKKAYTMEESRVKVEDDSTLEKRKTKATEFAVDVVDDTAAAKVEVNTTKKRSWMKAAECQVDVVDDQVQANRGRKGRHCNKEASGEEYVKKEILDLKDAEVEIIDDTLPPSRRYLHSTTRQKRELSLPRIKDEETQIIDDLDSSESRPRKRPKSAITTNSRSNTSKMASIPPPNLSSRTIPLIRTHPPPAPPPVTDWEVEVVDDGPETDYGSFIICDDGPETDYGSFVIDDGPETDYGSFDYHSTSTSLSHAALPTKAKSRGHTPYKIRSSLAECTPKIVDDSKITVIDDSSQISRSQRKTSRQSKPPKPPTPRSLLLSYLQKFKPNFVSVSSLKSLGLPSDPRPINELVGEGWLIPIKGEAERKWHVVGEWLVEPLIRSAIKNGVPIVEAKNIWTNLKGKQGFGAIGKDVVKEIVEKVMTRMGGWRTDGKGVWKKV